MLVKLYGNSPETAKGRYSPAECTGARKTPIEGNPNPGAGIRRVRRGAACYPIPAIVDRLLIEF